MCFGECQPYETCAVIGPAGFKMSLGPLRNWHCRLDHRISRSVDRTRMTNLVSPTRFFIGLPARGGFDAGDLRPGEGF